MFVQVNRKVALYFLGILLLYFLGPDSPESIMVDKKGQKF